MNQVLELTTLASGLMNRLLRTLFRRASRQAQSRHSNARRQPTKAVGTPAAARS